MIEKRTVGAGPGRKLEVQVPAGRPAQPIGREFVATRSHTAIVLLILAGLAIGAVVQTVRAPHNFVGSSGRLPLYGQILALQLLLLWFVHAGIRRSGYSVRALVDESPWNVTRGTRYVGVGIAGWVLWMIFGGALGFFLRPTSDELQAVMRFLPRGLIEKSCWVVFAIGTNFCEEVLYRGYLMRQLRAFTGSATVALLVQAVVFGIGHVPLGMALMLSVSLLALFLGALALWQKSLVPGMIAHTSLSVFAGLISST